MSLFVNGNEMNDFSVNGSVVNNIFVNGVEIAFGKYKWEDEEVFADAGGNSRFAGMRGQNQRELFFGMRDAQSIINPGNPRIQRWSAEPIEWLGDGTMVPTIGTGPNDFIWVQALTAIEAFAAYGIRTNGLNQISVGSNGAFNPGAPSFNFWSDWMDWDPITGFENKEVGDGFNTFEGISIGSDGGFRLRVATGNVNEGEPIAWSPYLNISPP